MEIYSEHYTIDDTDQIPEPEWEFTFFNFLNEELRPKLFKSINEMTWNQKLFYLALQYEYGINVPQNFEKALKLYIKGFHLRNSYCCYRLYYIYRKDDIKFKTRKNKDLAVMYLLISAAYFEFMPTNHKIDPKLYFAMNLDLEDYEKTKISSILDSLKYSPITESEVIFLQSWMNIYFNKNLEELLISIQILTESIKEYPFEHSILLLANFYSDPLEKTIEIDNEKAIFFFRKLENTNDPVVLYSLGKFYSSRDQFPKALNFLWKSCVMGFNSYNAFINIKLCYKNFIQNEDYKLYFKFFVNNLVLGDCNILADFYTFLKYIKMERKNKEKMIEFGSSLYFDDNENKGNIEKKEKLNKQIEFIKKLYDKYSKYFYSFIHFNQDILRLNRNHSINYIINIPYFLMNSFAKGSYGIKDTNKILAIANMEGLQQKINERHKNYLLMLGYKNINMKKEMMKYYEKYKELTKDTFHSNYLQCFTLYEFEFYLKNIKSAFSYLEIINSKNQLNTEYMYSNIETFYIQQKTKHLLADKLNSGLDNDNIENQKIDPKKFCIVCFENEKVVIFVPCGHKCCCEKCGDIIFSQKKKCPICTLKIEYKIAKVYD
jgi:hypothetical protein